MAKGFWHVRLHKKTPKLNTENKNNNLFCSQISNLGRAQPINSFLLHVFWGSLKVEGWGHLKACLEVDAGCQLRPG